MKMSDFLLIKIAPPPKYKALFLKVAFITKKSFNILFFGLKRAYLQNFELIYAKVSLLAEANHFLSCL